MTGNPSASGKTHPCIAVSLFLLILFSSSPGFGQELDYYPPELDTVAEEEVERDSTFAFSPISLLIGLKSVEYKHPLRDNLALAIRGSYWEMGVEDWRMKFSGVGMGWRWFWRRHAPKGGYLALNIDAGIMEATYTKSIDMVDTVRAWNLMPSAMVGYSMILGWFHLDVGVGWTYLMGQVVVMGARYPYSGWYPSLGFNVGFVF